MIPLATKVFVQTKLARAYFEEATKEAVNRMTEQDLPLHCSGNRGEGFFLQG
jgi:hypothetical protein